MAIREWLSPDAVSKLIAVATAIGNDKKVNDLQSFRVRISGLGMSSGEEIRYWEAIDLRDCNLNFSDDRKIAADCGILLSEKVFPRNYLLYRLAQFLNPQTLSVSIEVIDHKYDVASDRWEYVGDGQKKIMTVRLKRTPPPVQKKPKQKRRRRISDYGLERLC